MLFNVNVRVHIELSGYPFRMIMLTIALILIQSQSFAQQGTLTDNATFPTSISALTVQGSSATEGAAVSFIKFELTPNLPPATPGEFVAKATLTLYVGSLNTAGSFNVYRVTSTWGEGDTTAPTYDAGNPVVIGVPVTTANSYVTVDLTALAQQWLGTDGLGTGGAPNYGIALVANTTTTAFSFDSKESTTTSHPARLAVQLNHAATADTATDFTGTLAGDVTGTQNANVVSSVGSQSAASVANSAIAANSATNTNTPGTIVKRDAAGNFSAGTIVGDIIGNAATATNATNATNATTANVAKSVLRAAQDADIASPADGQVYYNTTSNVFKVFDGATSSWEIVDAGNAATLSSSATISGNQVNGELTNATIGGSAVTGNIAASQISGNITNATIAGYVTKVGDTMTGALNLPANGLNAGSDQLVLSAGNVGIGTTAPAVPLDVKVATNAHIGIRNVGGVVQLLGMTDEASAYAPTYFDASTLSLNASSGGNVGIGTPTPRDRLDAVNLLVFTDGHVDIGHTTGLHGSMVNLHGDPAGSTPGRTGFIDVFEAGINTVSNGFMVSYDKTNQDMNYTFTSGPGGLGVGIGMTIPVKPGTTLDVVGDIRGTRGTFGDMRVLPNYSLQSMGRTGIAEGLFQVGISGVSNGFTITHDSSNNMVYSMITGAGVQGFHQNATGNVGIGTTSPGAKLDVNGAAIFRTNGIHTNQNGGIFFTGAVGNYTSGVFSRNSGNDLVLQSGGSQNVYIQSTGKVGIGTNSPSERLEVAGNLKLSGAGNGFIFPNGTIQTTAANPINAILNQTTQQAGANFNISGNGTIGGTLTTATLNATGTLSAGSFNGNGAGLTNLDASNITAGTLDNARLGLIPTEKGGTGLSTPDTSGNFLRSDGVTWRSAQLLASDLPPGSTNYIQSNPGAQQAGVSFNIGGSGTIGSDLGIGGNLNVGGGMSPTSKLTVAGVIESNSGGFKFPDGTTQATAATPGGTITGVTAGTGLSGGGTSGNVTLNVNQGVVAFQSDLASEVSTRQSADTTLQNNINSEASVRTAADAALQTTVNGKVAKAGDTMSGTLNLPTNGLVVGSTQMVLSGGNVGIGTSSPQDRLHVNGTIRVDALGSAGSTQLCSNASNQIAICSSSLRYKTQIAPFSAGLEIINRLRPISFTWRDHPERDFGLGAEDVAAIEPLLVTRNAEGQIEGVKYDRVSIVLVNAIKQQQEQIKQQQSEIESLKKLVCQDHPGADVCK